VSQGILDTSVVIALAHGEPVALPKEASAISIVTLCELHTGVLTADDVRRPARLATLVMAENEFEALMVDARVVPHYARMMSVARRRGRRPTANDVLIAATAAGHGLPVYTRDRDFVELDGVEVVLA
jgi:predicted nucleic acid-binding protein